MNSSAVELRWFAWGELDRDRLYRLLQLRSAVFVGEQDCVFQDIDGRDQAAIHLCAEAADGALLGGLRLLPACADHPEPSIGRVVVAPRARGTGLGHRMTAEAVARCEREHPARTIRIAAQEHLQRFYGQHGFKAFGERYLDDGIWHVDMRRAR